MKIALICKALFMYNIQGMHSAIYTKTLAMYIVYET